MLRTLFSRRRSTALLAGLALPALLVGSASAIPPAATAQLADQPLQSFQPTVQNDRGIRLGSLGSGMFRAASDPPGEFYTVTDRGPNGQPNERRSFPVPDFDPTIVKVRASGGRIDVIERIPLRTRSGAPVTGLPNLATVNTPLSPSPPAPDEVPYNFDGSVPLNTYNLNGLDTEDIVRTPNGDFWLVEEYRPSVLKVAANGTILARYVPRGVGDELAGADYPVIETLPATHAYRRQNRGYEGLAISPDGRSLFVGLQSPLQLPPDVNVGRDSRNTRILRLDTEGRVTGEFVYRFDTAAAFDAANSARARDMKLSGLVALSATKLLVLERTDFVAKIYLVDIVGVTDIAGRASTGAALNDLESRNEESALAAVGITALPKSLVADLDTIDGMPDKIEAVAVVNPTTLAVINDNDFGLTDSPTWTSDGRLASDTKVGTTIVNVALPQPLPGPRGYRIVAADGGVFAFGGASFLGSLGATRLNRPIVASMATPSGEGYWLVGADGGVFAFGDAKFFGSTGALRLNRPMVGATATPSGQGYWLVAADGGVFAFGDARSFGSLGATRLNRSIVAMASTPTGEGYWLVGADGGVFAFGDAKFFGSTGALRLNRPMVGATATPSGQGYWLVAADGGVFAFGDARSFESLGATPLNQPVVAMTSTPTGRGYWLVGADGGVFAFGDAAFLGSTDGLKLTSPVVGMAAPR